MSEFFHPGTLAGQYRLERLLGKGGMGQVWAATDTKTLEVRALKFLNDAVHWRPDRGRRFRREARLAKAVNHPNVVKIHEYFELEDGTPVIVMDLLEGETLGEKLCREERERDAGNATRVPLALGQVVDILLPVVSAVGTAHSLGIIHRDLKPDNVFLLGPIGASTGVCVLDFGIAKLRFANESNDGHRLTDTGAFLGTAGYTSPEQGFGEKDVDHRTDLWAIGVMLYEAVSGVRPIDGDNPRQILRRLAIDAITPLEQILPGLPPDVASLVGRLLARDPASRPEDLREVAEILGKYGSVRVPDFGAAQKEPPPLDSSPASGQSSPFGARPAAGPLDVEARTVEDARGRAPELLTTIETPTFWDERVSRPSPTMPAPLAPRTRGGSVAMMATVLSLSLLLLLGYRSFFSSPNRERAPVLSKPVPSFAPAAQDAPPSPKDFPSAPAIGAPTSSAATPERKRPREPRHQKLPPSPVSPAAAVERSGDPPPASPALAPPRPGGGIWPIPPF